MAQDTKELRLSCRLNSKMLTFDLNEKEFLPEAVLTEEVNISCIQKELTAVLGYISVNIWDTQLPKRVHDKARKVFAILALMSKLEAMKDLDREGLTDDDLPLERKAPNILVSPSSGKKFEIFARYPGSDRLFVSSQWQVLAPVLDATGRHELLDKACALPIIIDNSSTAKRGGGSSIFRGTIHEAHCVGIESKDERDRHVAIKQFHNTEELTKRENFEKERKNLDILRELGEHPHLMRAIFSCQLGNEYYTVFPWADGGSLTDFWKSPDSKSRFRNENLLIWSFQQLLGIADALKILHRTNYRHGDLKPDNILYFRRETPFTNGSRDVLVIADFGVSRVHGEDTKWRTSGTTSKATTLRYEAPEANGDNSLPRSRRYDMWSMGCIILEFVVWLLYGQDGIERFAEVRVHNGGVENPAANFFEENRDEAEDEEDSPTFGVSSAVEDVMKALLDDPRCQASTSLRRLITLIPKYLLQPQADKRADAEHWWEEVKNLTSIAQEDKFDIIEQGGPPPAIPSALTAKEKRARWKMTRKPKFEVIT